jgi:sugar phosphate isomerase/epimerase
LIFTSTLSIRFAFGRWFDDYNALAEARWNDSTTMEADMKGDQASGGGMEAGLTRRSFLGLATLAPLAVPLASRAAAAPPIPIAVQLYSVRDDCKRNFDNALAEVASMGFEGVEFAGYYDYSGKPAELAKRLETLGLKAAGTHIGLSALEGDTLKKTIDFHAAIGCPFLIVPSDQAFTDPDGSKVLADKFNVVAQKLKPLGMACGYHNHKAEFDTHDGRTYWDLFAERTTREVVLQQDCGWTMAAGHDPAAYVRKYPGRTRTTHFKATVREGDSGKKAILGQDSVDWKSVYAACSEVGGTNWIILEQEVYPDGKTPMQCTRESLAGLKALVK